MSKSILTSVKPNECANILNHLQDILIMKIMPKCDLPIDVYIYCTKDKKNKLEYCDTNNGCWSANDGGDYYNGKVVAKFTLNNVEDIFYECGNNGISINGYKWFYTEEIDLVQNFEKASCLNENELFNYLQPKEAGGTPCGYAWHISNLEIFDKPKELSEFSPSYRGKCLTSKCKYCDEYLCCDVECKDERLTKAPQNFRYVEVE